ncbi:MAG: lysine--tRNA ligase, partial [Ruminiclostridium sp.]|nr:lysine--tRNA ligase [Ruminiclostridium sp.]
MAEKKKNGEQEQSLSQILKVRRDKLKALQEAGKDPFEQTKFVVSNYAQEIKDNFDAMEGQKVTVAGRIMFKRGMGKVSFFDLQDKTGRIQLYARRDEMDEAIYADVKKYDIGDIVGVKGEVFRTQTGEMSVRCIDVTLLSKSLRPLPEKFHGLTDKETRYRQRYVDLIMNPESRRNFEIRSKMVSYLRSFLDGRGYMEVETPVLNTISGGATARPFITHHNTLDIDMYMRIATELHLKMCIVGGLERVYEIGRLFRNEGMDATHNPEFTTIEIYQSYTDYHGMMDLAEDLIAGCCQMVNGKTKITYGGQEVDLTPPFARVTMNDAVKAQTGADFYACATDEEARELAKSIGLHFEDKTITRGK